jgi:CheY-like chemotaxis protein
VIGMTELMLRTHLNAQQRRYAWLIKSSGDTLLSLINDILDFSKIEAGKLELEHIDFDLHYVVENVAVSMASRAEGKGLELICGIHPEVPRYVRGDPGRLQQVLLNLTNNAIKFTEQGAVVIRVSAEAVNQGQATIRFTVTDTGIGIASHSAGKLFEAFSQLDSSTTRKYGGSGLGLAICKRLVHLMGGDIGVVSELDRGSTFWFAVELELQDTAADASARFAGLAKVRVLAVDDNEINRDILREQITSVGIACDIAVDAADALRQLRVAAAAGQPFGAAVIDGHMPGMSGQELGRVIQHDVQLPKMVLILLSSMGDQLSHESLRSHGFSACLTKPVRQTLLLETLAGAVASAPGRQMRTTTEQARQTQNLYRPIRQVRGAGPRILLAEDDEISQEVARTILTQAGCVCDVRDNGRLAVEAFRTGRYDLILMDCQMPELDGFAASREIRRLESESQIGGRIPIIALTANAIKGDRERCLDAGMDDYISKPLDPQRLIEMIDAKLHGDGDPSAEGIPQPSMYRGE